MLFFIFNHLVQLGLELPELDIVTGFHTQDGAAENKQLAHDGNGAAGYLAQRLDEEKTPHGDASSITLKASLNNPVRMSLSLKPNC